MSATLVSLIRAGNPLVLVETTDELRAAEMVRAAAEELNRPRFDWSLTSGLRDGSALEHPLIPPGEVAKALDYIWGSAPDRAIHLFRDLGPHCKDAKIHRRVRDIVGRFGQRNSSLVMVDAGGVAQDILQLGVAYELPWPTPEEVEQIVKQTYHRLRQQRVEEISSSLTRRQLEQLVNTLRGLAPLQVERIVTSVILEDFALDEDDIPKVVEAKRYLLGSLGCLETIAVDVNVCDIGGLNTLKHWLKLRRGGFTRKAQEFGLESPRGVLMLGVPGCGKSLCAKAVAADWNMPLLRLDPGDLYQKFIGESESRLRQALSQAEAMAPAVLWIDEIEKAFASASSSSADGGLSKRMFGTLLSWMQDHRHPIFIIATANDVSALPPELMRKGRFDEVFFVDLPNCETRGEILRIHLRRRKRDASQYDIPALAQAANDFSGSELEQVVRAALFRAFSEGKDLSNEHLLAEVQATRPLAMLSREQVHELRQWASQRCVSAD